MLPVLLLLRARIQTIQLEDTSQQQVQIDDGTNCHRCREFHQYNQVAKVFLQVGSLSPTETFGRSTLATSSYLSRKWAPAGSKP
jgi:hypothetical protein